MLLLGVPLVLPVALLTFFGGFIPVVGATVAGAVAVVVAGATGGTSDALITLAIVIGVQQFEGSVLEPVVMGKRVPLHPAIVLLVVAAGALLGGLAGAFAAVPLVSVATAFAQELYSRSQPADRSARSRLCDQSPRSRSPIE
jgi:predicted PurR-regulated permease PerM